jgi:IS5 family transposase
MYCTPRPRKAISGSLHQRLNSYALTAGCAAFLLLAATANPSITVSRKLGRRRALFWFPAAGLSLMSVWTFISTPKILEAWASVKSYQRKDAKNAVPPDDPGNATVDFHGEQRSNQTHESKTDPDAKMARKGKGKEAKLSYNGNLLVENRHGLIVNTQVFEANGTAARDAALVMLEQIPGTRQVTVGGDKAYDTADFVAECRNLKVTPHVAQNLERPSGSAIDARTTHHAGYAISQRKRERVEECSGQLKTIALLRKVRHRGIFKVGLVFTFASAAYNLVRLRNLMIQAR